MASRARIAADKGYLDAADDITVGDAAVSVATTVGNITIDAQANDADVIIKVDDAGAAVTAVTFDGSDEGNAVFVNDIKLASDAAKISWGADSDVTLTHVHNTGLLLNSTRALQFNDASQYINAPSSTVLDITATSEIELNATSIDINGNATLSGTLITEDEVRINGDGGTYLVRMYDSGSNLNFAVRDTGLIHTGTDTSSPYTYTTGSAANMNVNSNGYLRRSTSSLRFKNEVVPIEDFWADKLLDLKPIFFKSIAPGDIDDNDPAWTYYGFGAEDVAEVDPRYVQLKTFETTHDEETGEDTRIPLDEPVAEGVQYDRMVPALVNLIQRLTARVESLEAR
jgi:hypothetical protein